MENGTQFIREKKERDFTVINNTVLKDARLSWKAKGLFCYLLSLPEDWIIYQSELLNHATDGRESLRNAIQELEQLGYLQIEKKRDDKGHFTTIYRVIENPNETDRYRKPDAENPIQETRCGKPDAENPTLLNTNIPNTNKQSTNKQNTKKESFTLPTLEEVATYCKERNNNIDPMQFIDYYSARGWRFNNGGKMKDWRATVRTWERRNYSNNSEHKDFFSDCDKKTF